VVDQLVAMQCVDDLEGSCTGGRSRREIERGSR
jgi:hypothetical protein